MDKIDVLVRVRDGHRMIADALEEYLQTMVPTDAGAAKQGQDLEGIGWQSTIGPRGEYEKTRDITSAGYTRLLKVLEEHQGKMTIGNYFVWLFTDGKTIGRRKKT